MPPMAPRRGERPLVSTEGPQTQLSQQSPQGLWGQLVDRVFALPGVIQGRSSVSPASSLAVLIDGMPEARTREVSLAPEGVFEPVHLHGAHDTSLHLGLPTDRGDQLTALGWAEPHQFADFGTEFLVYGPRDEPELEVVLSIVRESIAWATGRNIDDVEFRP